MVTFQDIADELDMELEEVRRILTEDPEFVVSEEVKDQVFETARELGYDLSKLKIGKRIRLRKEVIDDLMGEIEEHPDWTREDILGYLEKSVEMVDRVTRRAFTDEFGGSEVEEEESSDAD